METDDDTFYKSLTKEELGSLVLNYDPTKYHTWPFFVVEVPLAGGKGPVPYPECDEVAFEVWDRLYRSVASYGNVGLAIAKALELNTEMESYYDEL